MARPKGLNPIRAMGPERDKMRERIDDIRRQRDDYRKESSLGFEVINALVADQVCWTVGAGVTIGYAKLSAPHGGFVLVTDNGYTSAVYLDEWLLRLAGWIAPEGDDDAYNRWLFTQQTAKDIKARRDYEMDLKYGVAVGTDAEEMGDMGREDF